MSDSVRTPIIGGNWKMNTTITEAEALSRALTQAISRPSGVDVVICPPFTNLAAVHTILADSGMQLGAQDVFWEERGAFTGEISAAMLISVGARWVICGHSERRRLLGESDHIVNAKLRRALENGLRVILAVGETEHERQDGRTEEVLASQLQGSLVGVGAEEFERLVIAYEPVWAIGTGLTASPEQAQSAHAFVRVCLSESHGSDIARAIRIQYGGSVTAENAGRLLALPDIDGALVGGASLKAGDFAAIVHAAAQTASASSSS